MRGVHSPTRITRVDRDGTEETDDLVVREEPLEIRVADRPVSVTLRTPGDDFDLAAGFLFTESIVGAEEIESIRHWGSPNVVRVDLREGVRPELERLKRNFHATSSCGVCGKSSIDAVRIHAAPVESPVRVTRATIASLPGILRGRQQTFEATGAIHGAGIFDPSGALLVAREDVGRHNAVDKAIGSFVREGRTPAGTLLAVSGRVSFEIAQKAVVARIPVLAAVGAPSSLAVDLARDMGLTLIGFVRDRRFNVYAGAERIA
jgi:FdhD protein